MRLTPEQIKDATWVHGNHCECERCDRRRAVFIDALAAYQRVAALLSSWESSKPDHALPADEVREGMIAELRRALYGEG